MDGTTNARRRLEAYSNQSRDNGGATEVAATVERSRDRQHREAGRLYVAKDWPRMYVKLILITHSNGNILAVMVANNLVARRDQLWMACHHLRSNKLR